MKEGKLPENVLNRSILKSIGKRRSEVLIKASVGEDCAVFNSGADVAFSVSNADLGAYSLYHSIHSAINNLAAGFSEPVGILISLTVPPDTEESVLRGVIRETEAVIKPMNIEIAGGSTEVSALVKAPVISITGVGKRILSRRKVKPGDTIVMSKYAGLEGTAIIADLAADKLKEKYPQTMVGIAADLKKQMSILPEAATAIKSGVKAMHDLSRGGVFAGLWELAEQSGVGLEADVRSIPIKQETVEICNFFDINPYELISGGSLLMISDNADMLVEELRQAGIEAAAIGHCTDSNDRVLINGETRRFLEPFKNEEIYKILNRQV